MRNVIVTGGSRGLGLAIAKRLAQSGYRVLVLARQTTQELERERQLAAGGPGAIEFKAHDLSRIDTLRALAKELHDSHGAPYGLINNAALGTPSLLSTMRDEDVAQLIELNVLSPILLTKYVVRSMMSQREGRIVNVASIVAATGYRGLSVYSATKASLLGFTRSLAREVGELGITVNALAPGFMDTAMTSELSAEGRDKVAHRSALKRLAEPVDVAASAEFLLSDGARNITGTVLTVDAGSTA